MFFKLIMESGVGEGNILNSNLLLARKWNMHTRRGMKVRSPISREFVINGVKISPNIVAIYQS